MRAEAQRKLKHHVAVAMRQIRTDLNERVKREVSAHASVQKASLTPVPGGGHMLKVVSQQTGHENFCRALRDEDVGKYLPY